VTAPVRLAEMLTPSLPTALNINVDDLTNLARVLLRSFEPVDKRQGWILLESACRAGSPSAIVFNVKLALRQKQLHHPKVATALQQLKSLVIEGDGVSELVLAGKVAESQGKIGEALELYKGATARHAVTTTAVKPIDTPWEDVEDMDLDVCTAWNSIANIHLKVASRHHDHDAAMQAFRTAAFEYDDPYAYSRLADDEPECTALWLQYRLKAAASGHGQSAFDLGQLYSLPEEQALAIEDPTVRNEILKNACSQALPSLFMVLRRYRGVIWGRSHEDWPEYSVFLRQYFATHWHDIAVKVGHYESLPRLAAIYYELGDVGWANAYACTALELDPVVMEPRWPGLQAEMERTLIRWRQEPRWKAWLEKG
jgi:hypothetical protein